MVKVMFCRIIKVPHPVSYCLSHIYPVKLVIELYQSVIYYVSLLDFSLLQFPKTTQPQLTRFIKVCISAIVAHDTSFHTRHEDTGGTRN